MPIGLQESSRLVKFASRMSSRAGMDTLLKLQNNTSATPLRNPISATHSLMISIISNPFEHKIAILAFRKIRSYASAGIEKSR